MATHSLENPHRQRSLAGCSPWGAKIKHSTQHRHAFNFGSCGLGTMAETTEGEITPRFWLQLCKGAET